ncbi:polysaccharide deacetylase family protein [Gottfriedia solisilvae]|uniref:polysaccharide deacetylase family protein n=1 Tax=Gottfriedia solisilvae TaxID=1516104 RepID=UPI003D2F3C33
MSIYQGKLIELLSIKRTIDKSFLHIRLVFNEEVELLWEIDNDTANLLDSFIGENYKYRLSLHSSFDQNSRLFSSYMTRTYMDKSEKINFICSEEYHNKLHEIKNIVDLESILELPYMSSNQTKKVEETSPRNHYAMVGWIAVAMLSLISTILIGYISHSCINKTLFCEQTPVKAESVVKADELKIKEEEIQKINKPKKPVIAKPTIPSITLNNVVTYSIPKGSVALTFDDGPSKYSSKIINLLKKNQAGGTFFYIGQNVKQYPDQVKYAHSNGFSIGSHSMNHQDFTTLTYKKQENDILQSSKLIKNITHQNVTLFRPPYGAKNKYTTDIMQKYDYKMVLWNKDTEDWKNRDANSILKYVKSNSDSGCIILLHESEASVEALPKIIEHLQSKDLKIVSLK